MTIAEHLKESIKEIVEESLMENRWLEVLQESEWFSDFVEIIVDNRLNEIQGSEYEDKYFLVRWGEGYSTNRPVVYEMKEFLDDDFWNLPSDFLNDLKSSLPSEKLKFTDLSGDVYFERIDNS